MPIKQTILIVEDEILVGEYLADILNKIGYMTVILETGEEAIEYVMDSVPDLILMDIGLTDINGIETAKVILKEYNVPIVFCTAYSVDEIFEEAQLVSFYGYLVKPISDEQLVISVKMALKQHRQMKKKDVSEYERVEMSLLESEKSLALAQQVAHIGSWNLDVKKNRLRWSDEIYRQFGLSPDEFRPTLRAFENFIHPDDRAIFNNAIEQALKKDSPFSIELRMIKVDGAEFITQNQGKYYKNKNGSGLLVGTQLDITERKQLEKLLYHRLDTEKLLNKISILFLNTKSSTIDDAINLALERIALFANAIRSSLFTFSDDMKMVSNTHEWCLSPEHSQIALIQNVPISTFGWHQEALQKHETIVISKLSDYPPEATGEIEWVQKHGFRPFLFIPLLRQGRLHSTLGFYGEIGEEIPWSSRYIDLLKIVGNMILNTQERQQVEKSLRESEEKFRSLVKNIPGISYRCLADEHWTTEFISNEIEKLTGYPASDFLQNAVRSATSFVHPQDLEAVVMNTLEKIAAKEPWTIEYRIIRTDGEIRWCIDRGQAIFDEHGNARYIDGVIVDITEHKHTELQLAESLKGKEVLLSEVHHRVKNNFQTIASLINLQSQNVSDNKMLEILTDLQNRIQSLSFIHEKLYKAKDVSKVDFGNYLKGLAVQLRQIYLNKKIEFRIDIEKIYLDIKPSISCGLIANELITNSFKHAFSQKREGCISINCFNQDENRLVLIVEDNGVGYPEGFEDKCSLGLKLVRMMTRQLDGNIEFTSDNGAHVKIEFPISK